jgi:hypothetical protein
MLSAATQFETGRVKLRSHGAVAHERALNDCVEQGVVFVLGHRIKV